jgi:predicted molibdopterin-dependent oxidoreductase YjgC
LLVVVSAFESALTEMADIVLPKALFLEKDGTFTNFDRTVQRVRAAAPAMGESKSVVDAVSMVAQRMGYDMRYAHPTAVMLEIGQLVSDYAGVTYARLERGGLSIPVTSFADPGSPILSPADGPSGALRPSLTATAR